jgi:gamma-glutamyltranspeptidase/glutathione hydrolase
MTIEAFRRAFFDRAEFMGDPDFSKIPVAQLIDKKYAGSWRESMNPDRASVSKELQRPKSFEGLEQYSNLNRSAVSGSERPETTHFSVVDQDGNAVAVTTTLNGSFGSHVTADGLGFLLNNEMDDFAAKQGSPNADGLIQGPANAIGPGKRPLSSMSPTIVLKDGKLFLIMGSPGSSRIISTVANILMGVVDYGLDIQQAVNAPRFHNQWLPDQIFVEPGFSPDTLRILRQMGHKIVEQSYWSDGECIAIDLKTGERLGASDGRNNGRAVGY